MKEKRILKELMLLIVGLMGTSCPKSRRAALDNFVGRQDEEVDYSNKIGGERVYLYV